MNYTFFNTEHIDAYLLYLKKAMEQEPEMMFAQTVEEEEIRRRVNDTFYQNSKSILAWEDGAVIGRIEYHFYGCLQDGYRMAYVDWVYVLRAHRHKGAAQGLFAAFEQDCKAHGIMQYYLIRAENASAKRFYDSFAAAETEYEPILRKNLR